MRGLREAVRFDSGFWRRFAELGCVYGPEWWKRGSPPAIAGIVFTIAARQRQAVLANQRQVLGARGWLREQWDAYRVFAEFARSVTEGMEQWGPRPRPLSIRVSDPGVIPAALARGRGLIVVTGHFGSWEVAARGLAEFGRPFNLVMAREANPTVRDFTHALRTRYGVQAIYSDRSVFAALPILQALRRHEVVGMQIDPWGTVGGEPIDFCGRPARFQQGPFALARVARAPLVPVFAVRTDIRTYEIHVAGCFEPTTPADSHAAFAATVGAYERLVRERPSQWLMFDEVWSDESASARPEGSEADTVRASRG